MLFVACDLWIVETFTSGPVSLSRYAPAIGPTPPRPLRARGGVAKCISVPLRGRHAASRTPQSAFAALGGEALRSDLRFA